MIDHDLLPVIDADNAPYFNGAAKKKLVIQQCRNCSVWAFFPRVICPSCLSDKLDWKEASGKGTLYSYTIVRRPHHPSFDERSPIVFAAVVLAEGPTMLSELVNIPHEEIRIGMDLSAQFLEAANDFWLPVWASADLSS